MKEINQHIESIITRKISGQISASEEEQLNEWLAEEKEHSEYFAELAKAYKLAAPVSSTKIPTVDIEQEWKLFNNNIKPKSTNSIVWRVAASITLVLTIGFILLHISTANQTHTVVAQSQGQQITLPDNSIITLNKGAKITYPTTFSKNARNVRLTGEAFFEITHNEAKPFTVTLKQSTVQVLGTSFNIDAPENNNLVEVIVSTGRVKFTETNTNQHIILTKGEKGTLITNKDMLTKSINSDVNFLAWKTRKMVFSNMALDDVIKTINRLYDAKIAFATDVDAHCNVTVTFENQSLEEVLDVLTYTLQLEYTTKGNVLEITKTGCQ